MNQYEAMFLFDPTFGASFEACEAEINRLLVERAGGEILFCRKWDERRLAYRIKGRKRGVYVLTYFKAEPDKIAPLERDVQISEKILRILVLTAEHMTPELMELSMTQEMGPSDQPGTGGEDRHKAEYAGDEEDPQPASQEVDGGTPTAVADDADTLA